MATRFLNNCKKLRTLMKNECVMLPGAFNGQVGRLCAENGELQPSEENIDF